MSSSAQTTQVMLLFSLSETPHNKLLEWYEDVCAQARGLCAAFDIAGALSLVAYPTEWNAYPGNLTNAADVLANGDPPNFRARPTFAQPADQPPTLLLCDNECAVGLANKTMVPRLSKSIDMRFHWLQDRIQQRQFKVEHVAGNRNGSDYFTKALSRSKHDQYAPYCASDPVDDSPALPLRTRSHAS